MALEHDSPPTSLKSESATTPDESNPPMTNGGASDQRDVEKSEADVAPAPVPSQGPSPPPNGDLTAWLQVMGGFFLFFNTWGLLNTFGIYQTYYESGQLFTETSSNIAWIGSMQAFLVLVVGCLSGPYYDRGHLRILLLAGAFCIVFGHMMLSLCSTFWEVLLAQGFVVGIGGGCLFVPGVAIIPTYFSSKIGLAMGLAASGSSMGGIIYPIVFYKLIDKIGFAWTTRVIGFIALATLIVPIFGMKMRVKPPKPRAFIDPTAFTDLPYMTFVVGTLIGFIGLYVMLFYISYFGESTGITDASLSFYIVPILNAASMFGRTLPNILSDKIGPFNVIGPGALVCGIIILCMLAVKNAAGLIVVAIFFGFFSGIFIALPPVLLVALTPDKSKIGTRIGMGFAMISFGVLAGGPGGGGVLGKNPNDLHWTGTWVYGGVCTIAAAVTFIGIRLYKTGLKLAVKM